MTGGLQQIDPYVCIPALAHPWLHRDAFASGYFTRAFGPGASKQQIPTTAEVCEK